MRQLVAHCSFPARPFMFAVQLINLNKQAKKRSYKNSGVLHIDQCEVEARPTFIGQSTRINTAPAHSLVVFLFGRGRGHTGRCFCGVACTAAGLCFCASSLFVPCVCVCVFLSLSRTHTRTHTHTHAHARTRTYTLSVPPCDRNQTTSLAGYSSAARLPSTLRLQTVLLCVCVCVCWGGNTRSWRTRKSAWNAHVSFE